MGMRQREMPQPGDSAWVLEEGKEEGKAAILVGYDGDHATVQFLEEVGGVHSRVTKETIYRRKAGERAFGPGQASDDPFDQLVAAFPKVIAALQGDVNGAQATYDGHRKHLREEKNTLKDKRRQRKRQLFLMNKALGILTNKGALKKTVTHAWTPEQRKAASERMTKQNERRRSKEAAKV